MAEDTKVTLEELMVTNLAMADATAKLLIKKGVFTEEPNSARSGRPYLAVLKRLH